MQEMGLYGLYHKYLSGPVAQLVEQRPFKAWAEGSSPSWLTSMVSRYCSLTTG